MRWIEHHLIACENVRATLYKKVGTKNAINAILNVNHSLFSLFLQESISPTFFDQLWRTKALHAHYLVLALILFCCARKLTQELLFNCWWNWLQDATKIKKAEQSKERKKGHPILPGHKQNKLASRRIFFWCKSNANMSLSSSTFKPNYRTVFLNLLGFKPLLDGTKI